MLLKWEGIHFKTLGKFTNYSQYSINNIKMKTNIYKYVGIYLRMPVLYKTY